RGSRDYRAYDQVRKSIFGGVAVCAKCGHALCSCGTVYKGEREKYWYLSCTHQRQDIAAPCEGVRIRYADLVELVRQDLNSLLALSDGEVEALVQEAARRMGSEENLKTQHLKKERAEARLTTIDKIVTKLYTDNAMGKLDNDRLSRMVADLEKESAGLKAMLEELNVPSPAQQMSDRYTQFFELARSYTHLDELDRDTLVTFVDRIEIGPKIYENGSHKIPSRANQPYRQSVHIFYKFIGELAESKEKDSAEKPA
uniref:DUF4368 domain-containing protein n=1 Tax=uncultured Oscillibacter sp. TaxID=876091 RepID=UPI0026093DCA